MQRRWSFVATAAAVAASMIVGLQDTPAQATGATGVITDADGVDYDATCMEPVLPSTSAPAANSVASPNGTGCTTSSYDGSTESSDIRSVSLESTSTGRLKASMTVDGQIPAPGSTNRADLDSTTGTPTFAQYFVLFQNKDKQTGADNPSSGCTSNAGARFPDLHGHWADGYHYFLMYGVDFRSGRWVHTLNVGEWSTDLLGYYRIEVARNSGSGWTNSQTAMAGRWATSLTGSGPTTIDMEVTGRILRDNSNCASPANVFVFDMGSNDPGPFSAAGYTGDTIANVKGATFVDMMLGVPGVLSGGHSGFSDVTDGNSTPNALNTKIPGVSLTFGLASVLAQDTFASGPFCPLYFASLGIGYYGGPNPLAPPNQPCQIDDDQIDRGTFMLEWWETNYGFTF